MKFPGNRSFGSFTLVFVATILCVSHPFSNQVNGETDATLTATSVARPPAVPKLDPAKAWARESIELVRQSPKSSKQLDAKTAIFDFGQVAFGNLELTAPVDFEGTVTVRFGEALKDAAVNRKPPGTVRFSQVQADLTGGTAVVVAPPADERNTQQSMKARRKGGPITPPAVLTPPEWGVVTPFRWVEIEGVPDGFDEKRIVRRAAFPKHWNDEDAGFVCSDESLNEIWELCRYSIKATMFAGVYVDGDRERIPYEADAYLNQLSHYYVDRDPSMARLTFDWLMQYPTWPTEWGPQMVFMAHAEWMRSGDVEWIRKRYPSLKAKTLGERVRESGLVHSNQKQVGWNDIIDWPPPERDGYVRSEVNTVVNAFHLAATAKMADLAEAIGAEDDAKRFRERAEVGRNVFGETFFDEERGLYRDGLGVDHHSVHANFFPLAFGLVKPTHRQPIVDWLTERGMRCSTYAAQYLLEGLFENGGSESAVDLIKASGKRSWKHMLDSGATITWESWNEEVKKNWDWNHAWGAAPANLLPRYVLGVEPLAAGWTRARVRPNPGGLEFARGVTPTPLGPVAIDWTRGKTMKLKLTMPKGMTASVQLPTVPDAMGVVVDGQRAEAELKNGYWVLAEEVSGLAVIEVH